jgi:hypothetical protein
MIASALLLACGAPPQTPATSDGKLIASQTVLHRAAQFGVPTFVWLEPGARPLAGSTAKDVAQRALAELAPLYRLSPDALSATALRAIHDTGRGTIIARYAQQVGGYPVYRLSLSIALDRTLRPVASSGYLAPRVRTFASEFAIDESAAIKAATALPAQQTPVDVTVRVKDFSA